MNRRLLAAVTSLLTLIMLSFFGASVSARSKYNISIDSKKPNSITLTWDEQSGADAYRVMVYSKSKGKYETFKTVVDERCAVTGLSPSTSYKVKIQAVKKVKGKYKKLSESGAVTVKTAKKGGSSSSSNDGTKKKGSPSVTPQDMRAWKQYYKDSAADFNDPIIKGFINKIKNAGYTVDDYPYYSTKTLISYYVIYDGKVVGSVHADLNKVWFEIASSKDAAPTKIKKESAKVPVSKLREWKYTYEDVGDKLRSDSYVLGYLNKFKDAGYTVDQYPYIENSAYGNGYYIYYGDELVGSAWIKLTPYYKSGYSTPTYRVDVSFEPKGTIIL